MKLDTKKLIGHNQKTEQKDVYAHTHAAAIVIDEDMAANEIQLTDEFGNLLGRLTNIKVTGNADAWKQAAKR